VNVWDISLHQRKKGMGWLAKPSITEKNMIKIELGQ
jgi:hypothetical protein